MVLETIETIVSEALESDVLARLTRSAPVGRSVSPPFADDPGCRPVLAHGDYQPSNLLAAPDGTVTGVFDSTSPTLATRSLEPKRGSSTSTVGSRQ
ncbi:hypothetical protein D8Y22_05730 [Salinadaptatus halalkaliphilus]|uniref:Uncharacterized protein n=1 Tax=Salinadaptatus halalkaliphilus TaxID=2419781 RepID=A0A4V3VLH5_9EURY|nr:phosphotransferase [Salinadaptatus halalkaliphilus]THE65677.1 hypothetical protein D8Y22_05730 [Salinadaptatus halalkaliphilus]